MALWPLQLRGDFPGILFGLTAIRLLLARFRYSVLLAGCCAGLALQFKITYLAPMIAGSIWLLYRRQWKDLAAFATAGVATSAGLYLFFWMREPRMVAQMLTLSPGVRDVPGCVKLVLVAAEQTVVPLALTALPLVAFGALRRRALPLIYALVSFSVAAMADIQAGGNVNYFFECLFAIVPLAVLGVYRLLAWSRNRAGLAAFLTGIALLYLMLPAARDLYHEYYLFSPRIVSNQNRTFRQIETAVQGRHIFSSIPRIALLDPRPPLMEPILLSYLWRLGKFDPQPLIEEIRREEFDLVILPVDVAEAYRGLRKLEPRGFTSAIGAAYHPQCTAMGMVMYLPRHKPEDLPLVHALQQAECVPLAPPN